MEIKDPYTVRYIYKNLYSLVLHNNPTRISVSYRLDNEKNVIGQFELFLEIVESQIDADELIFYIQKNIGICDGCRYRAEGRKKTNERCGKWVHIRDMQRLSSVMCNASICKYHRGKPYLVYNDYDIKMLKRMIDVRIEQIDKFCV